MVALWHSVQLFTDESAVPHVYAEVTAPLCPLLWHWFTPQDPNVPPFAATGSLLPMLYVKLTPPTPRFTDPFACVFTVAAPWQSSQTAPAPVFVVKCAPCEFVTSVAEVPLWHSVQLFTD